MTFDADKDGKQDILVKLNHITNNKALITITELDNPEVSNEITGMTTGIGNNPIKAGIAILILAIILLGYAALKKKH
ncbi:MAG: hypothetical protein V1914_01690 [archaeon]